MTAAGTAPEMWQETYLLDIVDSGGTAIAFAGLIQDISDITNFEKDITPIQLGNGGMIAKYEEFTAESMTLKVIPITAGIDGETTATGVDQLFNKQSTDDSTQPILVDNTITRQNFGIVFLRATTLPATASTVPAGSVVARRTQIINAKMTISKDDWSDKSESVEITLKWMPFQKDGTSNRRSESTDGSESLPAAITSATSF